MHYSINTTLSTYSDPSFAPSGDIHFTGSTARYGAHTFERCFASTLHHRKNIAVQSHTKVSTLNQDLTLCFNSTLIVIGRQIGADSRPGDCR